MVDKYKLLLGLLGFHFVYFALGFLFQPYISSGVSIGLALASFFVMARYAKVTYGVLFRGLRNDEQDNSHIAAISIFGVAFGVFYGAAFNLVWQYSGSPIEWLGTHASNYGRFITALSFAGLFYSPQEVQKRIDTSLIVLGLAVVVVAVASFVAGTRISTTETIAAIERPQHISPFHPICPEDRPIWGSQAKIYHDKNSMYRQMVIPRFCFVSVDEAQREGFRAPN